MFGMETLNNSGQSFHFLDDFIDVKHIVSKKGMWTDL